ncbi:hypothetical protein OH809_45465 (plasmid) [Streptomyces sp. NBC_00873]|uniref:hypothetical protein n=1 Tax=Streptomyces sp. NBC_00873 TaxID=2975852 RepID=UPI0037DBF53F|nr:hypothetical protein OH809_45465 [Streptomyces sp. NBC_00873]
MTPSIAETIAIGLSLVLCAASFVMARHSRAYRAQAEASAGRAEAAVRAIEGLRMIQQVEDDRRAWLRAGNEDVNIQVRPSGSSAAQIGDQVTRAIRRGRRDGS